MATWRNIDMKKCRYFPRPTTNWLPGMICRAFSRHRHALVDTSNMSMSVSAAVSCPSVSANMLRTSVTGRYWATVRNRNWLVMYAFLFLPGCRADMSTTTQDVQIQIDPYAKVSVPLSVSFVRSATAFSDFSSTIQVNYRARTSNSGGGTITVQASSEFSAAGGPSSAGGDLTVHCSAASMGVPCSGTQTISRTQASPVVTLPAAACTGGGGACSTANPNSVQLNFSLRNKPAYKTGNYSITVMFNVSSI